jgi:eukaryotic-like serine/threonine-protein kinase
MPVPLQPVELLDWLERYQLLTPGQVHELRPQVARFPDARALAADLIRRDWLTPYQVNQIMQDRGDQLVLGALQLRERLGEGAMGQVFKGWHTRLEQVIAIKTLHRDLIANARAMDRFRQEIEAASQLHHPNIVKVRDAGEIDGRPFLVMDYVDGTNLSFLVKTQGPLPVPIAVECARQAAVGLQHAFERGVVHRDVKPGNLVLQRDHSNRAAPLTIPTTKDFCIKILDFGLARFDSERRYSPRLTHPGSTLGTVDYMAPEQAESARDVDTRADIFALGCTLFFLLTGKPPFPGASVAEKIKARLSGTAPSVREARPEVPAELARVLERMMARQPADRYQTPAEVAAALQPFTEPAAAVVPRMELDRRVPLAMPVTAPAGEAPVGEAPVGEAPVGAVPIPLAHPIAAQEARAEPAPLAEAVMPSPPVGEGLFALDGSSPFASGAADDTPAPTLADPAGRPTPATSAAARKAPAAAQGGLNPRIMMPVIGGGVLLLILSIACSGYMLVSWIKGDGKANIDAHPANAGLQITEAFLSSDFLRVGDRKFVIVKLRRINFNGPVEVRLEDLPPGVVADKESAQAGTTAVQVRITAPYGIEPADQDIRVVARAKNLTTDKVLRLQVLPAKKTLKMPAPG